MKIRRLTDTGEWTTRRYLSLLGNILIWIIVAIDAWYLWPTQLGGDTSIVVVSGSSMEPTFFGGDLVIARKMPPSIGDVIVYAPEGLGGSQIVHRIIGGNADEGWRMQGDNNDFVDPFTPQGDEVKGVVLVHYANFGRVTVLLLNPMVWAFVLLAAMVLMLWWTGDDCDDDDDDDDEDEDSDATGGDHEPKSEEDQEPDLIDRMVEGAEAAVVRMAASVAAAGATMAHAVVQRVRAPRHVAQVAGSLMTARVRGLAVLALVGVVAIVGPSTAFAAQLTVNAAGQVSLVTVSKCDSLTLTTAVAGSATGGSYPELWISGISANCQAPLLVTAYVHLSDGTVKQTAPASASGSTMVVSVPGGYDPAQVTKVVVKINGWLFLPTWFPPTIMPGISCQAINPAGNSTGSSCIVTVTHADFGNIGASGHYLDIAYDVTTKQNRFEVTIDYAHTSWPGGGLAPVYVGNSRNVIKAPGYACSSLPIFRAWKAAGDVPGQNNGSVFAADVSGYTNGTTPLCP